MSNQSPTQVIMSGMDVYYAPVGTAFPADTRAAISASWKPLSVLGRVVQSDAGVELSFKSTYEEYSGQGNFVLKAVRTMEEQTIKVSIADTSSNPFALALNNNNVSPTAAGSGTPGFDTINSAQGEDVNYISLLFRGFSPSSTDPSAARQINVPKCYQMGEVKPSFKRAAAMLDFEFKVVRGPNANDTDPDVIKMLLETAAPL